MKSTNRPALARLAAARRKPQWHDLEPLEARALLAADLAFRDPSVSYEPLTREPGQDFLVTVSYRNLGDTPAGAFDMALFLTQNETLGDSDDIPLGTFRRTGTLSAGGLDSSFPSVTIPDGTPDGTYRVAVRLDSASEVTESNEGNNEFINTGTVITVDGPGGPTGSPEISVTGKSKNIENGDTSPRSGDHTDFRNAKVVAGFTDRTFTISNTGNADLNISEVRLVGNSSFVIVSRPESPIAPGQTGAVVVRFDPGSRGLKNASLEIVSNDADESTFAFSLRGRGLPGAARNVPDTAVVSPNNRAIRDGDTTASNNDRTKFGRVTIGQTKDRAFTIRNDGNAKLGINPDAQLNFVRITGDDADQFSIVSDPSAVVQGGQTTTFTVRFSPTSAGSKNATIEIVCSDGTYTFAINGNGRNP